MPYRVIEWALIVALLLVGVILLGIVLASNAYAYGRPVTEPTNEVWSCSYPYKLGLCQKDK